MTSKRYFLSLRQPTFSQNYEICSTDNAVDFISPDFPNRPHYVENYSEATALIGAACKDIEGMHLVFQENIDATIAAKHDEFSEILKSCEQACYRQLGTLQHDDPMRLRISKLIVELSKTRFKRVD